ncbi:MAG: amidohydrolase family protein [Candidatus Lokiarchaeota archaeon]|nr:amidohydrolase family protein [Candidatus Lokiarchaeota archaeon]MBD3199528.1 amidohydrolase family protein [Candidatus Lokiarchaeota archaeon]
MIVDSHVHLFFEKSDPEEFFIGCSTAGVSIFGKNKPLDERQDPEQLYEQQLDILSDKDGSRLIGEMDKAKIDKAILLPLDFWLKYPKSDHQGISIKEKNKIYSDVVKKYPDRFKTYFGIDPRRKDAIKLLNEAMKKWEPVGLKIHPTAGFYPDNAICFPLYETAIDYGIPILIHSGQEPAPMEAKWSHPMYIDTVAANYPEATIIIAHCGHGWWRQALDIAIMKPNIYVDFSGWQPLFNLNPHYFWEPLRFAIDTLGPWRVLFGSDGSMLDVFLSPKKWAKVIANPSRTTEINFTQAEIEIFMGKAAQKLYNL